AHRRAARPRSRRSPGGAECGAVARDRRSRLCDGARPRHAQRHSGEVARRSPASPSLSRTLSRPTREASMTSLRSRFQRPEIVVAPGCYDALSAHLIERTGFEAAYLSGAAIAYTRFARPDIGLVSMSEVADTLGAIAECVSIPLIVDADTGFGNALNVMRTVKLFANRGAAAIQLEDQTTPKRCGHL